MTPKTGELDALGVHAYLDDNSIHRHGRRTINEVNRLWREWFDGLYADGATTGRVMVRHLPRGSWASRGASGISTPCSATSPPTPGCGRQPAARSSTGSGRRRASRVGFLCGRRHPRAGRQADPWRCPRPVRVCPDHRTTHYQMARQRRVAFWVAPNRGVLRGPAGESADPARYPALCAHGLRQSRRLLAHARRAEHAPGPRLLLNLELLDHFPQ